MFSDAVLGQALVNTLWLILPAEALAILFGVTLGLFAAWRRGKAADVAAVTFSLFMWALPIFFLGIIMPFYGAAVVCADDAGVQAILGRIERPVVTYGLSAGVSVRAVNVQALAGAQMRFSCEREGAEPLDVLLNLAGEHNVRNALAAIAIATELDCADADILKALASFSGVGRRFEGHAVQAGAGRCHRTARRGNLFAGAPGHSRERI